MSIVISGANVSKVYAAGDYVTDVEVKAKASLYVSGGACVSGVSVTTSARLFISDRGEVDTLIKHLAEYRDALTGGDRDEVRRLLAEGDRIKKELDQIP